MTGCHKLGEFSWYNEKLLQGFGIHVSGTTKYTETGKEGNMVTIWSFGDFQETARGTNTESILWHLIPVPLV